MNQLLFYERAGPGPKRSYSYDSVVLVAVIFYKYNSLECSMYMYSMMDQEKLRRICQRAPEAIDSLIWNVSPSSPQF